ncbi:MAG TPA: NB-ARC domain-containing protein, partial [Candidatus Cybelea sp.]
HAGVTDERDGDYFGSAVNRAARLVCAGHGGQILLSGDAADQALGSLPSGITLHRLGSLPLRGLEEPERVYQPVGSGLRSDFKPLRALETPPNNLPRQTTSFVGRHDDLAHIEALLDECSLVTVVGAGGIGKTRLALEVAAARLNDERDGAWFVDLSSIGDASLISSTILSALGGERSPEADPLADLLSYLHKRELLLVLDNSEHLVSEVAAIATQIIGRCAHVTVLATSRSPLDIAGERVYRLSSLDPASAMQLFGDRARAANPSFRVELKASIVEEICNRLDGIALAIELAAARVRTMSVENLASHLELRLLAGGRDRRQRQQTMRALIDWSYDLLSDDERDALRRASVFAHGFTLTSGTGVCAVDGDEWGVLELLTSLVDKSLVVAELHGDDQRYRLLAPIREYAYDKLTEAAEVFETMRRHAAVFGAFAQDVYDEWDRGPAVSWLARSEVELSNFRVALRWAFDEANDRKLGARIVADTTVIFLRLGLLDESIAYCRRVLEAGLPLVPEVEARVRYGLSMLYSNRGANKECLDEALVAVALYREASDSRGLARALSQISSRYAHQSRYDEAKAAANEALRLARDSRDARLIADVLRRCAEAFAGDGAEQVRAAFSESVALFRTLGRDDDTARALNWWGSWELQIGEYRAAAERLMEAIPLAGSDTSLMFLTNDITSCFLAIGDRERAAAFARQSLVLATQARHDILTFLSIAYLGMLAHERDPRAAARLIGYAQERLRAAGWKLVAPDNTLAADLHGALRAKLKESELDRLLGEGAVLSNNQAVAEALSA